MLTAAFDEFWSQVAPHSEGPATWRCVLEDGVARALEAFARSWPRREVGGILLGSHRGPSTRVSAAVFPPQARSAWDACEFETATLTAVCDALETLPSAGAAAGRLDPHSSPPARVPVGDGSADVSSVDQPGPAGGRPGA